jgi:hypothetical protein
MQKTPTAVLAHHGWGSYDAAHPITVAGTAARLCAVLSLTIWFATAACGRLIAYF